MALDFNGTTSQILYTLTSEQIGNTLESWSFWIYPDSVAQYRRPIHLGGTGSNRDRSFEMDDGWGFVFNFNFSTSGGAWSVAKPSTGAWVHYAVTFDGSSTSNDPIVYKNGSVDTLTERVAPSGTLRTSRTDLYIGSEAGTGQYWDGRIADVAKWNRILTSTEITNLASGMSARSLSEGLVLYTPLANGEADLIKQAPGVSTAITAIAHPPINFKRYISGGRPRAFAPGIAR